MKILDKLLKRLHIKQDHWAYTERPLRRKCKTCGTIQAICPVDPKTNNGHLLAWANLHKTESNEPATRKPGVPSRQEMYHILKKRSSELQS